MLSLLPLPVHLPFQILFHNGPPLVHLALSLCQGQLHLGPSPFREIDLQRFRARGDKAALLYSAIYFGRTVVGAKSDG